MGDREPSYMPDVLFVGSIGFNKKIESSKD